MAGLSATELNLLDTVNRIDASEQSIAIAELLDEVNDMEMDYVWMEGTHATENIYGVRTKLPAVSRRALNERVPATKSSVEKRRASYGNYEAWAQTDVDLLKLHGNPEGLKEQEARAHVEAMSQEVAQDIAYGDERNIVNGMTGIMPYYNDLGLETKDNVIDAGGTGTDNRSILLVAWSPDFTFLTYPRNSEGGLQFHDYGHDISESYGFSGAGLLRVERCHFKQEAGLCIRDWRGNGRIANIDYSNYWANWHNAAAGQPGQVGRRLFDYMFRLKDRLPPMARRNSRLVWYMSSRVKTILGQQLAHAGNNSYLTKETVGGISVEMFDGDPVRIHDRMGVDEARVT